MSGSVNFDQLGMSILGAASIVLTSVVLATRILSIKRDKSQEEIKDLSKAVTATVEAKRVKTIENILDKAPQLEWKKDTSSSFFDYVMKLTAEDDSEKDAEWSLVEGLVNSYHRQALAQSTIQFWFSVVAAIIGFVVIIISIVHNSDVTSKIVTSVSGVIIDAVAALFFKQAGETRQRATDFFDRLRTDEQQTKALELVESIDDETIRAVVKAHLAVHMAGLSNSEPLNLSAFLTKLLIKEEKNQSTDHK